MGKGLRQSSLLAPYGRWHAITHKYTLPSTVYVVNLSQVILGQVRLGGRVRVRALVPTPDSVEFSGIHKSFICWILDCTRL